MKIKSLAFLFFAFLVILNIESSFSLKNLSRKNMLKAKTKVIVETLDGKSTFYNLADTQTIEDLKKEISNTRGIDVKNQRIIFEGQEVNGKSLRDFKIGGRSVVNLILQISDN